MWLEWVLYSLNEDVFRVPDYHNKIETNVEVQI